MEVIRIWKMKKLDIYIDMINDIDIKDKLRLAICMSQANGLDLYITQNKTMKNFML